MLLLRFIRKEGSSSARAADYYVKIAWEYGVSQRTVARLFQISQPALSQGLKLNLEGKERPRGRPKFLDDAEQVQLYTWIEGRINDYNSPSVQEIRHQSESIKRVSDPNWIGIPSKRWVKRWLENNGLILNKAVIVNRSSLYINPTQVRMFLDKYSRWIEQHGDNPNFIWNFDETGVHCSEVASALLVAAIEDTPKPLRSAGQLRMRTTLGVSGSASGLTIKSQCILPEIGWKRVVSSQFIPMHLIMLQSGKGWQTKETFRWFIHTVFIPGLRGLNLIGKQRILLVLDGHSSRRDPEAIQDMLNHGIDCLVLPANSSKYLQPLDQVAFGVFKKKLRSLENPISKLEFLQLVESSLNASMNRTAVKGSWEKADLAPFDRNGIEDKLPVVEPPSKRRHSHVTPLGGMFLENL